MRIPTLVLLALLLVIAPMLAIGSQCEDPVEASVLAEPAAGTTPLLNKQADPSQTVATRTAHTSAPRARLRWQSFVPGMIK